MIAQDGIPISILFLPFKSKLLKMKHTTIIILLALVVGLGELQAQPTITNVATPQAGDMLEIFLVEDPDFTHGPGGVGITWNFSAVSSPETLTAVFKEVANTPYEVFFPESTIALEYETPLPVGSFNYKYEFFSATSNSWTQNGIVNSADLPIRFDDPELLMMYPFEYLDEFVDDFSTTFEQGEHTISRSGTITVQADGYGSLVLPDYEVDEVLRLHVLREYVDEVVGTGISFNISVETYAWYAPDLAYPVLSISTETVNDSPINAVSTINYMRPAGSVGIDTELTAQTQMIVYPNPATDQAFIAYDLSAPSDVTLNVYNLFGQLVSSEMSSFQNAGRHQIGIDVRQFVTGLYIAELVIDGHSVSQKIQVGQ